MRKLLLAAMLIFSTPAFADYTFVIPQRPGSGTSIWAEIVAKELEPFLGEKIIIKNIPGGRDIPGFNKFHNELQYDDKTVMVSHGGNGVSFLQEKVDYDYNDYTSIGLMNLNIITAIRKDYDPQEKIKFSAGSGQTPEAYAMAMLLCGPRLTTDEYIACFKDNVVWVKGMKGGERRLAFRRGELNATREILQLSKNMLCQMKMQKFGFTMAYYNQTEAMPMMLTIRAINLKCYLKNIILKNRPASFMMHINLLKVLEMDYKKPCGCVKIILMHRCYKLP